MEVPKQMPGAQNFPALIHQLHEELRQSGTNRRGVERSRWRGLAHELTARWIKVPRDFLDWAKRDRHWSFTLAEVMRESHSGPSELASRLLAEMLEELEDERETHEAEVPAEALMAGTPLYAE
jgi:hypothetical protein